MQTIDITSSLDQTLQPAYAYAVTSREKRPLLVGLHTWSCTWRDLSDVYSRWARQQDWHFVFPDFRGANNTPQAMGSELAVQDILDAVAYMKTNYNVDEDRIYLAGVSGGGHMASLMAGRHPEIWAGVSAWCQISDIRAWWTSHAIKQNGDYEPGRYAQMIENCIGGRPDENADAAAQAQARSPLTYLANAAGVPLDINHGVSDGRTGSVPFPHSLRAFNAAVKNEDKIPSADIDAFWETGRLTDNMAQAEPDALYGPEKQPVFRKTSGNTRVTIFQGGHEMVYPAALNWLAQQRKGRPAVWNIEEPVKLQTSEEESQATK